jgi:hypothetical protein
MIFIQCMFIQCILNRFNSLHIHFRHLKLLLVWPLRVHMFVLDQGIPLLHVSNNSHLITKCHKVYIIPLWPSCGLAVRMCYQTDRYGCVISWWANSFTPGSISRKLLFQTPLLHRHREPCKFRYIISLYMYIYVIS